jgi:hypothetical protein
VAYTDTCVSIKDTSVAAWLNPNVMLTGPMSDPYKADAPPAHNQPVEVRFTTDLEDVEPGQAHVFHLTHVDRRRRVRGGLTLLALRQRGARATA